MGRNVELQRKAWHGDIAAPDDKVEEDLVDVAEEDPMEERIKSQGGKLPNIQVLILY